MNIDLQGGASVLASRVPQEHLKIARHFNAGLLHQSRQVPEGRPTSQRFSRPCGTGLFSNLFPALKRRAIIGKSLRDCGVLATLVWLFAVGAKAEATNGLSDAEIKGRELARQLVEAKPAASLTQTGFMNIRRGTGERIQIPFEFRTVKSIRFITSTCTNESNNWFSIYQTLLKSNRTELRIGHPDKNSQVYVLLQGTSAADMVVDAHPKLLKENEILEPFAGSDFSIGDLGLEFFHWPAQKLLPKTTNLKRGREYTLLESTNPNPPTNGYSRVLSWIDKESGGILQAEAYDAHGRLLKVFEPKSFKKVNGQWELQEMEIRNVQTGSRTRLEFDLKNSGAKAD